jgi:hypothetical protein
VQEISNMLFPSPGVNEMVVVRTWRSPSRTSDGHYFFLQRLPTWAESLESLISLSFCTSSIHLCFVLHYQLILTLLRDKK